MAGPLKKLFLAASLKDTKENYRQKAYCDGHDGQSSLCNEQLCILITNHGVLIRWYSTYQAHVSDGHFRITSYLTNLSVLF